MLRVDSNAFGSRSVMDNVLAFIGVAVWIYLLGARGAFWLARVRDTAHVRPPDKWPAVTVVIPARNESECIALSVQSLLRQAYSGPVSIIVVDDDSTDGTAAIATGAAEAAPHPPLTVIKTNGPAQGWTGKLWALNQGIAAAEQSQPEYLLLTDA